MSDYTKDLEARLAAASIAWQDMLAAESTTTRLRRYSHLTKQMELDFSRANRRFYEARADLNRLLKTPHPETLSPVGAGCSFNTPRVHTGD